MIALIGKKLGMMQIFNDRAELIPVTVIGIEPNYVLDSEVDDASETADSHTKSASCARVSLASTPCKAKHLAKAQQALYTARNIPFQKEIAEFKNFDSGHKKGDILTCSLFKEGEYVDVVGWSKGKGYQGVIKRYGFGGGRASHGSKFHREVGSTGMAAYPAKTLKNTKMAGRMPVKRTTVQNLAVVSVDNEKGVLLIRGAIPGPTGRRIIVRNALKKRRDID